MAHFHELDDPRSTINQRHPLASVLVIAILAVLAGAGGPTAIARWAAYKEEFLAQVLDLPNGTPRKAAEPAAFQACFNNWLRSLREEATTQTGVEQPILPIHGKTLRRSHDHNSGLGQLNGGGITSAGLSAEVVTECDKYAYLMRQLETHADSSTTELVTTARRDGIELPEDCYVKLKLDAGSLFLVDDSTNWGVKIYTDELIATLSW